MKKVVIFLAALVLMSFMVVGEPLDQPGTVTIGEEIVVTIEPADFGTVYPGDTPTAVALIDNTGSNVEVLLDSVTLETPGTVFDSLTIDGTNYGDFGIAVPAFDTASITLQISIPASQVPATVGNTITYTVTGPPPAP